MGSGAIILTQQAIIYWSRNWDFSSIQQRLWECLLYREYRHTITLYTGRSLTQYSKRKIAAEFKDQMSGIGPNPEVVAISVKRKRAVAPTDGVWYHGEVGSFMCDARISAKRESG